MIDKMISDYLYLAIINKTTYDCFISFLTSEDLIALSACNKKINKKIIDSNQLIEKEMATKSQSLGEVLFRKDHYFDRANKRIAETIWKYSDKIYKSFYEANRKLVQIYFFAFFILATDVFSLLIVVGYKYFPPLREIVMGFVLTSPFLLAWLISIIVLIVYRCKLKGLKKKVRAIVEKNKSKIICATDKNIEKLCSKIRLRSKYCRHTVFENWLKGIIIFFVPFILKLTIFIKSNCIEFFFAASSLFYIVTFCSELGKFIKIKWKTRHDRLSYYKKNYPNNPKLNDIVKTLENNKTILSEPVLNFFFFLGKMIVGFLFIVYFSQIGAKLNNNANGSSWMVLFIPFYILYIPLIGYTFLHCCSLASAFKKDLWKVIVTIIPFIGTLFANFIIIPMRMENRITINAFWIPGLFLTGKIFLSLHIYLISSRHVDY